MAEQMIWARAQMSIILPHLNIEAHEGDVVLLPPVWVDGDRAVPATPDEIKVAKAKQAAEKAQQA